MDSVTEPARGGRRRRSPTKHDAILRAATEVFLREGYTRASVDAIAEAAGVGKQTVYGHFGDKQRLFLTAVDAAGAASGLDTAKLSTLITDTGDPRADLQPIAVSLLRAVTAPDTAALHRLTIAELPHHPELQRHWRDSATSEAVVDAVATYLAALHRRKELYVPHPKTSARQFTLLLAAEGQVRSLRGLQPLRNREIARVARETVDLIVRAHVRSPAKEQSRGPGARAEGTARARLSARRRAQ